MSAVTTIGCYGQGGGAWDASLRLEVMISKTASESATPSNC
jgi:hypothetical protein